MRRKLLHQAEAYVQKNNRRSAWRKCVQAMACIVVFCTTYALILPALTLEKSDQCQLEEHTHDVSCYVKVEEEAARQLNCVYSGLNVHKHVQQCYDEQNNLICGLADFIVHEHDASCRDEEGTLVCQIPEVKEHTHNEAECYEEVEVPLPGQGHIHDDSCYVIEIGELTCQNSDGGHTHTSACYTRGENLTCGQQETEGHAHGTDCYQINITCTQPTEAHTHGDGCYETQLLCTLPNEAHVHSASCYETQLVCTLPEDENHTHGIECNTSVLTCTQSTEGHVHTESCSGPVLVCTLPTEPHVHGDACVEKELVCTQAEVAAHAHTDACYEQLLTCTQTQGHTHDASCYAQNKTLTCGQEEAEQQFMTTELVLNCDKPEIKVHSHIGPCYEIYLDENNQEQKRLICTEQVVLKHDHTDTCFTTFEVLDETQGEPECGLMDTPAHTHTDACKDASGAVICGLTETKGHQHSELCYGSWELVCEKQEHTHTPACSGQIYACGKDEHKHDENCYTANGTLTCELEEHTHSEECGLVELTEEQQAQVDWVISRIDSIPSADEVDVKMAEFEDAGDEQGLNAWFSITQMHIENVYNDYYRLDDMLKPYVTNAEKLMDLEFFWGVNLYMEIDGFESKPAQTLKYQEDGGKVAHTADFIEVNLYNYNYDINKDWGGYYNSTPNTKYPGFQWPGGAYLVYPDDDSKGSITELTTDTYEMGLLGYRTDRHQVDSIAFGDSIVKNFQYADSISAFNANPNGKYGKAPNATKVGVLYTNSSAANTGKVNWLWWDGTNASITNRPAGMTINTSNLSYGKAIQYKFKKDDSYTDLAPVTVDNISLGYLFPSKQAAGTVNPYGVTKQNSQSIDGLFQINPISGLYYYNSRDNHAEYSNNKFTLYDAQITANFLLYPFGNFLPFNQINTETTQVGALNGVYNNPGNNLNGSGGMYRYVRETERRLNDWMNKAKDSAEGTGTYGYTSRQQLYIMLEEYIEDWYLDNPNEGWSLTSGEALEDFFANNGPPGASTDFITQEFLDKIYNIDWDLPTDFFFGMDMSMDILMPKDGLTGHDNGDNDSAWTQSKDGTFMKTGEPDGIPDYPMVFNFAGDDDVWVYIDGLLFLDLTGIHRHVGGTIDFETGMVYYFPLETATGDTTNNTTQAGYYYAETFEEIIKRSFSSTETAQMNEMLAGLRPVLNADGSQRYFEGNTSRPMKTFADYSTHTFKFFYMERGSGSSVCRMNFNFPLLKKNSIQVTKKNVVENGNTIQGEPDYYFNIMKKYVQNNEQLFIGPNEPYKVMDSAGNYLKNADGTDKIFTTDAYGIFSIKQGQTAVFENIPENAGEYYVQELIKEKDWTQYDDFVVNGSAPQFEGKITWTGRQNYFHEYDPENPTIGPHNTAWYGVSAVNANASNQSSFFFEQDNYVDETKLVKLAVSKNVETLLPDDPGATAAYRMYIQLDGKPLAEQTVDIVDATTDVKIGTGQIVQEGGYSYIELKHGEKAIVPNILSGSSYTIWESTASSNGYNVVYKADPSATETQITQDGKTIDAITGEVHSDNPEVQVTVTNTQKGNKVEIPITKEITNYVSGKFDFTFNIVEVEMNQNGTITKYGDAKTQTITVESSTTNAYLGPIVLLEENVEKFFLIYEVDETPTSLDNKQAYVIYVHIENGEVKEIKQSMTGEWDGEKFTGMTGDMSEINTFTNTLLTDLIVTKTVDQGKSDVTSEFGFKLTLTPGSSGLTDADVEKLSITLVKTTENSEGNEIQTTETKVYGKAGIDFNLKDGEEMKFSGLPAGMTWTVTETSHPGYLPSYTVGGETSSGDVAGPVSLNLVGNRVDFTNTSGYELPETGGAGTFLYTMVGLTLMTLSVAYLLYNKNRRRGAYESP